MKYATVASTLSRYYSLCLLTLFFCLSLSPSITYQHISSKSLRSLLFSVYSISSASPIKMEMMDRQSIWKWYTGVPMHCAQGTWASLVLICGSPCTTVYPLRKKKLCCCLALKHSSALIGFFFQVQPVTDGKSTAQCMPIIVDGGLHLMPQTTAFINRIN